MGDMKLLGTNVYVWLVYFVISIVLVAKFFTTELAFYYVVLFYLYYAKWFKDNNTSLL